MTETTQPTDAEILDAADDFRNQYSHGGTTFDEFDALSFARAVLEKWGQPAQAEEPVAVVVPCYTPSGKRVALCSAKQDLPIGTKLYAAPQPSPTAQSADSVQEDAARYRLLRRGRHWSVIDGIGNDLLRGDALDAAVDAVRKQGASHDR